MYFFEVFADKRGYGVDDTCNHAAQLLKLLRVPGIVGRLRDCIDDRFQGVELTTMFLNPQGYIDAQACQRLFLFAEPEFVYVYRTGFPAGVMHIRQSL